VCGIAGWIDWERDLTRSAAVVEAMGERLGRRGPDERGLWLSERAALAHRRLIVIDPAGGKQPMERRRGADRYAVTYNGELYNTQELRAELEAKGYDFQSRSDTEVLLAAFMEWGEECVARLNGIFAFAAWSEREQKLLLARDRFGVKPLFYCELRSGLLFGSEPKALLAHPDVEAEVDLEGLAEVFSLGPARTPGHGIYRGIKEVRPGYLLVADRRGARTRPYWSLVSAPHTDDFPTTVERVRHLFTDAVRRQLVSDVPICSFLSGGVDSSAIAAVAAGALAEEGRGKLRTFSVEYRGNDRHFRPSAFQPNADAPWVRRVSEHLGTEHREVLIETEELVGALEDAVRARDLPGMADVDASLYLLCREVKKEATVALSGECSDEIFGGYPWFHRRELLEANTFPWSRAGALRASWLSPELREAIRPEEYAAERYHQSLREVPRLEGEDPRSARMRELFYLNFTWFMATLLDRKDRMSMAWGLEVRVPFCDHRLVEYLWNVPWEMKFAGNREKGLLREALRGLLPSDVLERKKSPYPKTHNPAYAEAVRSRLLQLLDEGTSPLLDLIDQGRIRSMAEAGGDLLDEPWFGQLMTGPQLFAYLLEIDFWLREYRVSIRLN